jgi:hypothetical protein
LFIDAKLTTEQYDTVWLQAKDLKVNMYPSYYIIKEVRNTCYPPQETLLITEICAEIKL